MNEQKPKEIKSEGDDLPGLQQTATIEDQAKIAEITQALEVERQEMQKRAIHEVMGCGFSLQNAAREAEEILRSKPDAHQWGYKKQIVVGHAKKGIEGFQGAKSKFFNDVDFQAKSIERAGTFKEAKDDLKKLFEDANVAGSVLERATRIALDKTYGKKGDQAFDDAVDDMYSAGMIFQRAAQEAKQVRESKGPGFFGGGGEDFLRSKQALVDTIKNAYVIFYRNTEPAERFLLEGLIGAQDIEALKKPNELPEYLVKNLEIIGDVLYEASFVLTKKSGSKRNPNYKER